MSKLGARRRRLARLRDARAASALRSHSLLVLLAAAAMLFAAGCRLITPGAGAEGAGGECPDQQQAAAQPAEESSTSGPEGIAETARSIEADANQIAQASRAQRLAARSIADVARKIAADADQLAAGTEEASADAGEQATDQQASAETEQAGTDRQATTTTQSADSTADVAARMADGARFIATRAGRIAAASRNAQVDTLAQGIVTKAEDIVADAEALGQDEPVEDTTTTTAAPPQDCETTTTAAGGGEETTTTAAGGGEETTTTAAGDPVETTAPTTTLAVIDLQNCDPAGLNDHTGVQTRDGQDVCHRAVFGILPGAGKTPAVRIIEPDSGATLPVGEPFTATIRFVNWQGGLFDDPASQYGVRPFSLAPDPNDPNRQVAIGHSHIYVQRLNGDEVPAERLDAFLALNNPSEDGQTLSGTVPPVAEPGLYRICTDLAGGNHLTFPKGVAQAVPQADCIRVTFQ